MKAFILMADIKDSSSRNGGKLMDSFSQLVEQTNKAFKKDIKSPLTITLGDEFQGVVTGVKAAINVIIFIEEELIGQGSPYQLRWVLNQGEISTEINTKDAHGMLGEGLTMAREQLSGNKRTGDRFYFRIEDQNKMQVINEAFYLYQYLIDDWHEKDLEIVSLFLAGKDYKEVAKITGKDDSTTWRREKSLGVKAYETCKSLLLNLAA